MFPRLSPFDSSLAFLREGYAFGSRRFASLGGCAFRTRIALRPVVVMRGADATRLFREGDRFIRLGARPKSATHLLRENGAAESSHEDTRDHGRLMSLADLPGHEAERLVAAFREEWQRAAAEWAGLEQVELYPAVSLVLTRAVTGWAGVLLTDDQTLDLALELGSSTDTGESFGPAGWAARLRGTRADMWARGIIRRTRSGEQDAPPGSALRVIVEHRTEDGAALDDATAAAELLNLLRPAVATARFIVFAALALHRHHAWAAAFAAGDDRDLTNFVNEVRRFYPFDAAAGGRAALSFSWQGHFFEAGDRVLLDVYGTNHDETLWRDPYKFRPERFRDWRGDHDALVPHGDGGDRAGGLHGESVTIQLITEAVRQLTHELVYSIPDQDLRVSLRRFPALPESGLILRVAPLTA